MPGCLDLNGKRLSNCSLEESYKLHEVDGCLILYLAASALLM